MHCSLYLFKELAFTIIFFIVPCIVVEDEPVAKNGVINQSIIVVENPIVEEVHSHIQETEIWEGSADKKESTIDHLPTAADNEGAPAHETPVVIQDALKNPYASIVISIQSNLRLSCPTLDCNIVTKYLMDILGYKRVRVMKENVAMF